MIMFRLVTNPISPSANRIAPVSRKCESVKLSSGVGMFPSRLRLRSQQSHSLKTVNSLAATNRKNRKRKIRQTTITVASFKGPSRLHFPFLRLLRIFAAMIPTITQPSRNHHFVSQSPRCLAITTAPISDTSRITPASSNPSGWPRNRSRPTRSTLSTSPGVA